MGRLLSVLGSAAVAALAVFTAAVLSGAVTGRQAGIAVDSTLQKMTAIFKLGQSAAFGSGEARPVLQIGDPRLRRTCIKVTNVSEPAFVADKLALLATLNEFRRVNGFGRAIAAAQIGSPYCFLAMHLGLPSPGSARNLAHLESPFVIVNPEIGDRSLETFTMWDDCMSFPWLLVRVQRHKHIALSFLDASGVAHSFPSLPQDQSELVQHEHDHLVGVLATDRAIDEASIVSRAVFDQHPEMRRQVDYGIQATL